MTVKVSVALLCVGLVALCSAQEMNPPDQCCFHYFPRRIKTDLIASYRLTDDRCRKPAVILVTVQNRNICVDPSLSWVEAIVNRLDERAI